MNFPTFRQLRYLIALDNFRHFGKAAQACFVSQSAFSTAIKELETLLDVQLVDRTNKSVTFTAPGKKVSVSARICLADLENLIEGISGNKDPLSGKLFVGIIPTVAPFLIPGALNNLQVEFPKLRLYLKERTTQTLYEELMAGRLDAILIALPYDLKHVEVMPLFKDRFRLACRENTKWLDPGHYGPDQLKSESVLLLEDGHCLRDHALSACKLRNHEKINQFSATSLYTLLHMVDNDMGITFIPEMAENSSLLKGTRIRTYPMAEKSYREIGLVWRKNSAQRAEFEMLGKFIKHQNSFESV